MGAASIKDSQIHPIEKLHESSTHWRYAPLLLRESPIHIAVELSNGDSVPATIRKDPGLEKHRDSGAHACGKRIGLRRVL